MPSIFEGVTRLLDGVYRVDTMGEHPQAIGGSSIWLGNTEIKSPRAFRHQAIAKRRELFKSYRLRIKGDRAALSAEKR